MKWILTPIVRLGEYLMSLSDRTRLRLAIIALLVLGGGGVYKFTRSIQRMQEPLPKATPEQLIKPMESLFRQTTESLLQQQASRQATIHQLDSLKATYSSQTPHKP
ncbi:hypothetical protein GCM10023187_53720 [Nibrella viscosa]|uniref:Uncharacterized protein n=1 Tax=Nibrella viscosa TaxID=1084524 RepID=A0ABP8L003_9BACT